MALGKEAGELGDGGFAGEIDWKALEFRSDGGGDRGFAESAEENDVGVVLGEEGVQRFGEAVGGPAFGGAVGGSGADGDADGVGAGTGFEESLHGAVAGGVWNLEGDVRDVGELVEPAGAAEEFEIVKLFVRGNFAGLGNGYGLGEKEAAGVAGVADALRNLRAPGEPGGVEGVLEKQGDIEFSGAKFGD